jgi:hypothetical protein
MQVAKDHPELAEVRAILLKMQRLGLEPEEDAAGADYVPRGAAANAQARPPHLADVTVFDRKAKAIQKSRPATRSKARLPLFLGAAGALVTAITILFATGIVSLPSEVPAWSHQEDDALLTDARRLLSEGNVSIARSLLLRGGAETHADLAFVLAQSYDPNYLQSLPNANSTADPSEAARWYKEWYELAVRSGLEMDPGRLQRVINAMPKH